MKKSQKAALRKLVSEKDKIIEEIFCDQFGLFLTQGETYQKVNEFDMNLPEYKRRYDTMAMFYIVIATLDEDNAFQIKKVHYIHSEPFEIDRVYIGGISQIVEGHKVKFMTRGFPITYDLKIKDFIVD